MEKTIEIAGMTCDGCAGRVTRVLEREPGVRESTQGSIDDDLQKNYADDVVVLTRDGVHRGHPGLRELNRRPERRPRWGAVLARPRERWRPHGGG